MPSGGGSGSAEFSGVLISELIDPPRKNKLIREVSVDGEWLLTPQIKRMFQAVMKENVAELAQLLKDGTDVTARNGQGLTMYALARDRGKIKSLQWLAGLGIDWEAVMRED